MCETEKKPYSYPLPMGCHKKNIRLMRHFIIKLSGDFCYSQISLRFNNSLWLVHARDYRGQERGHWLQTLPSVCIPQLGGIQS